MTNERKVNGSKVEPPGELDPRSARVIAIGQAIGQSTMAMLAQNHDCLCVGCRGLALRIAFASAMVGGDVDEVEIEAREMVKQALMIRSQCREQARFAEALEEHGAGAPDYTNPQ